ncbi:MAG TPA: arsenic resistance N-acetyltransferase ArsN2 [Xanthobacteraceae bacterium]|nr:arsenic resistance N-acetyltransferase ArsN2 [Xanthobacteraceae bacterium]
MAHPLPAGARAALCRALEKAGLPIDDVEEPGRLFWRFETEEQVPVGYGGLEVHGKEALVRSVLTLPPARHRGIGAKIVAALETEAFIAGCRSVWAITASAGPFFERLGYAVCERSQVPEAIAGTRQFRSICPDSARVLVKGLR